MKNLRAHRASTPPAIAACLVLGLVAASAEAQQVRRPTVITGPTTVYGRGYSPGLAPAAGFSYRAGYAPPIVVPNYTASYGYAYGPAGGLTYTSAPTMPFGAYLYGSTYPGYGYGFGTGYGFGYLGYGYGYPGYTFGFGQVGTTYPLSATGYVNPSWPLQQMQGFYSR